MSIDTYYNIGWRAYDRGSKILISPAGAENDLSNHPTKKLKEHIEFWQAIRAYQDEQRKKGVMIPRTRGWDNMSTGQFWFTSPTEKDITEPIVKVYDGHYDEEESKPIGQFTNFRWKAGYPKNEIRTTMSDLVTRLKNDGHDVIMDYPKGGQNG